MQLDSLFKQHQLPCSGPMGKLQVHGLACNSQEVNRGYIFVAYKGAKNDGHRFIGEAIERGAIMVIGEEDDPGLSVPYLQVKDGRKLLARLAASFYGHPSKQLMTIGVTGTNGKTTTTIMIDHILEKAGHTTGLLGTLYNKIAGQEWPATLTTPDSIALQSTARQMKNQDVSHLTMEVSSHSLSLHRVEHFHFDVGIITNLERDHLDWHKDEDDYAEAKKLLFKSLDEKGIAIANGDDPKALACTEGTKASLITYGLRETNQVRAENLQTLQHGTAYTLIAESVPTLGGKISPPMKQRMFLPVPGKHNVYNALAATTAAIALSIDPIYIVQGFQGFKGVKRRFELIINEPYQVIDDCAHNPANLDAVFRLVAEEECKRLIVVYGIRGSRGIEINQDNGKTLGKWGRILPIDHLIVTSCYQSTLPTDQVLPEEEEGFLGELDRLGINYQFIPRLTDSLSSVIGLAREGDLVLLLGAHPFDEAGDLFRQLLQEEKDYEPFIPQDTPTEYVDTDPYRLL